MNVTAIFWSCHYALISVIHPDWLIASNFRLRVSDNFRTDSHQNSWISTSKKGPKSPFVAYYTKIPPFKRRPRFCIPENCLHSLIKKGINIISDNTKDLANHSQVLYWKTWYECDSPVGMCSELFKFRPVSSEKNTQKAQNIHIKHS